MTRSPNIDKLVGQNVKHHRIERRMTASFVAFELRVDAGVLEDMEAGRRRIGASDLRRLCRLLSISPADIYRDAAD